MSLYPSETLLIYNSFPSNLDSPSRLQSSCLCVCVCVFNMLKVYSSKEIISSGMKDTQG